MKLKYTTANHRRMMDVLSIVDRFQALFQLLCQTVRRTAGPSFNTLGIFSSDVPARLFILITSGIGLPIVCCLRPPCAYLASKALVSGL